jgi:hypothetical protein
VRIYNQQKVRQTHTWQHTNTTHEHTHPAMLLMDRLFERWLPWKGMTGRRDNGPRCSSGDKMADHGRSLIPGAAWTGGQRVSVYIYVK